LLLPDAIRRSDHGFIVGRPSIKTMYSGILARAGMVSFSHWRVENKRGRIRRVKYWEIIADNLSKADWSWGCVSAIDSNGRTIWIADAHHDDGKRFVAHADEELAFLELKAAIHAAFR
jgi:hypothetical protein